MAILNTGADASKGDPDNPSKAECNALRKQLQLIADAYRMSVKVRTATGFACGLTCLARPRVTKPWTIPTLTYFLIMKKASSASSN